MPTEPRYTLHDAFTGKCVSFYLTGPNKGEPCQYDSLELPMAKVAMRELGWEPEARAVTAEIGGAA